MTPPAAIAAGDADAGRVLTTSAGIARDAMIPAMLGRTVHRVARYAGGWTGDAGAEAVVAWGRKPNSRRAHRLAARLNLPLWRLEDGFYAYLSHPSMDRRRLSLVVDDLGIYYDATRPSRLEAMLNDPDDAPTADERRRAADAMARIRRWRLSKYNVSPYDLPDTVADRLAPAPEHNILVVDQTLGDMSVTLGLADGDVFDRLLETARSRHPGGRVFLKVHPDVALGRKKGHFDLAALPDDVTVLAEPVNAQALLARIGTVYVATSQMGFEALIAGCHVICGGMPFYAGWGLTEDWQHLDRRNRRRTLVDLVAYTLLRYARYGDPFNGDAATLESVLDYLTVRQQMPRLNARRVVAAGFSLWKRGFVPAFLAEAAAPVHFIPGRALRSFRFRKGDALLVWGRGQDHRLKAAAKGVPVWRMEDGFIRSVGLGSDLSRPASLVLDSSGIYYDGGCPSDLETFLARHDFHDREVARGAALARLIRAEKVSKYNVGRRAPLDFRPAAAGRTVILVPGQVAGDASLRYGAPEIGNDGALLAAVRDREPDAFIVYKPHPDVVSGNRADGTTPEQVERLADQVVVDADILDCLMAVDVVHTMTSLTGFEALLRDVPVFTYGRPFYAGWGLTTDGMTMPRRGRHLPLGALVYGLLVVYARNVAWPEGVMTSPEALVRRLSREAAAADRSTGRFGKLSRLNRKIRFLLAALAR
ncbi:capsular polysaccharide biosynthesis protein [Yunchengibacter salinarum]|uniref:capsular polysaccharide biosynthesis protein n=1 Tax=Yunchengibacter salinarum TaxID=3133399 RepID=UPI0035B5C402